MRLFALALLASLVMILRLQSLAVLPILLVLFLSALVSGFFPAIRPALVGLVVAIVVLASTLLSVAAGQLNEEQIGTDLDLLVQIGSIPVTSAGRTSFHARVLDCTSCVQAFGPRRLQLSWYRGSLQARAGETWRMTVRLKPMVGLHNEGGFDRSRWALAAGLHAHGYIRSQPSPELIAEADMFSLPGLRQGLSDRLAALHTASENLVLVQALTLGLRQGVDPDVRNLLQQSGTAHLLAISGLHITLVAAWGYFLGRCLSRRHRAPAFAGSLGAAFVYALLAGFDVPVQRALIMLSVWGLAGWRLRNIGFSRVFCLALSAVLLHDPLSVLSAGFWLSFGTVAILFYLHHGHVRNQGTGRGLPRVKQALRTHASLGLVLLPISALFFQSGSIIAPLANLLAVPWVGLVTVPLSFATLLSSIVLPELAGYLLLLAQYSIDILLFCLRWLVDTLGGAITLVMPGVIEALLALSALLLLFAPPGIGLRWLSLPLLLPALWFNVISEPMEGFEVHVLDVGQGLAVLVFSDEQTLLFDTGGRISSRLSMFEAVVVPFMHARGRRTIDVLVVSHTDDDHSFGVPDVLRRFPDVRLIGGDDLAADLQTEQGMQLPNGRLEKCLAGRSWQSGPVTFSFLHPGPVDAGSGNDLSCVLLIQQGGSRVLLTGDIEHGGESLLVSRLQHAVASMPAAAGGFPVDLLVAPHHGSSSSSTWPFVEFFSPDHVVYTAGYLNRYGFPHADVQLRYEKIAAMPYITGTEGAVSFVFSGSGLDQPPSSWWRLHRRFWHGIINPVCSGEEPGQSFVSRMARRPVPKEKSLCWK